MWTDSAVSLDDLASRASLATTDPLDSLDCEEQWDPLAAARAAPAPLGPKGLAVIPACPGQRVWTALTAARVTVAHRAILVALESLEVLDETALLEKRALRVNLDSLVSLERPDSRVTPVRRDRRA